MREFFPFKFSRKDLIICLVFLILSIFLFFLPNKYEKEIDKVNVIRCKALVIKVDNSEIHQHGIVKIGEQGVWLKILTGKLKGKTLYATNTLMGYLDRDKIFKKGDIAYVVITLNQGKIVYVNPQDLYRLDKELFLAGMFVIALLIFGGLTGIKAVISFTFTALVIWKILIPYALDGINPILLSLGICLLIMTGTLLLVAGFSKKAFTAILGCLLGIAFTCVISYYFIYDLRIPGAILPFSEPLLYAGFGYLDLTKILIGSIFLCACGAIMDISVDIAASMSEVLAKRPDISRIQLIQSGINVGRPVLGTMVTTLLLAYSGEFITVLMFFMAQGIPATQMMNIVYVAGEIIKILAGSLGLVLTAPFTALVGGYILKR